MRGQSGAANSDGCRYLGCPMAAAASSSSATQSLSASRKRLTLVATILGSSIAILDSSVVSVALPSIQRSLGGGLAGQQWVSNAYLLTLGSLILLGGSLGDIFGERRIFALGVGAFGVTSLLCAVAPSIGLLIAFRALQGVAGALLTPSSLAVIVATFPERERGPAIGTWTAWGTIAGALGPFVAGAILNVASWRWIFVINLPLVLVCLWLIQKAVPEGRAATARRNVDITGALLCVLGLGGSVFALIEQPRLGWSSFAVTGSLIGGVTLFVAFLFYESRARDPMLRLDLFKSRNFAVGNVETLALYGGLSAMFFFLVLYLQQVAGYTPLKSGLALLPESIVMFALSSRFAGLIATVTVGALVAAQFSASLDQSLGRRPLTKPGEAAVAEAKRLTLGRPSVAGVPPREAAAITAGANTASLDAFRLGIGVAGGLVIVGGLIGAAGIRNPRRVVRARHCSGGQLAGAPLDAAGVHAPQPA